MGRAGGAAVVTAVSTDAAGALAPLDAIGARRVLERAVGGGWTRPAAFGPDGYALRHPGSRLQVIVTRGPADPASDEEWLHASIAHPDRDPSYAELVVLHRAVFGDAWAYQVFAPRSAHVNIHAHALHLWGRADGSAALPNFGAAGTI